MIEVSSSSNFGASSGTWSSWVKLNSTDGNQAALSRITASSSLNGLNVVLNTGVRMQAKNRRSYAVINNWPTALNTRTWYKNDCVYNQANWIVTDYNNQNAPGNIGADSFIKFGGETVPCAASTVRRRVIGGE